MGIKCGIVGLPNVGKSTLFNALTAQEAALAANYPFATIEPNIGMVAVPDERLAVLVPTARDLARAREGMCAISAAAMRQVRSLFVFDTLGDAPDGRRADGISSATTLLVTSRQACVRACLLRIW